MVLRLLLCGRYQMASQALLVIGGRIMGKRLMRVVASDAGKARVAVAPAAAVFKTIGLEPHVSDAASTHFIDVIQRAMASATEVDEGDGIQPLGIKDGEAPFGVFFLFHQFHLFGARAV